MPKYKKATTAEAEGARQHLKLETDTVNFIHMVAFFSDIQYMRVIYKGLHSDFRKLLRPSNRWQHYIFFKDILIDHCVKVNPRLQ